jgi:sigma-70-like protein
MKLAEAANSTPATHPCCWMRRGGALGFRRLREARRPPRFTAPHLGSLLAPATHRLVRKRPDECTLRKMGDADLSLLNRWCAGDASAGNDLFKRHFASMYRFFERKIDGEIDDLVQETFLQCLKSRQAFQRQSSFRTYLFAILSTSAETEGWSDSLEHAQ